MKLSPFVTAELQKKHPELCYMFRMFLKKWLGGEYWEMWMEIDRFKETDLDATSTRIVATQIFDKYWSPASEYNIGIFLLLNLTLFLPICFLIFPLITQRRESKNQGASCSTN
jgi:hypothetical protein